ncbi:hypothetical protein NC651_026972 [Populus alba x Populus x berolinensis]|nr:hypothetical protein NC651_026972 [Populus alba x Populus x berolinensis]
MDNLVSIYKSMKIASGFNIFITLSSTKLSCLPSYVTEEQMVMEDIDKSNMELSVPITFLSNQEKSSVPQYTLSDTPALRTGSRENKRADFKRKNPVVDEKGEPILSPFFWLRDEDGEKSSKHTDVDQLLDIPPPNVPTFSDIKRLG